MGSLLRRFQRKVKSHGLFTFLAIISIIGFALQSIKAFWGLDFLGTFAWSSVLLGVAFIFESQIKKVLTRGRLDNGAIPKLVTFVVGVFVLAGGLSTIPFLGLALSGIWAGMVGFANFIAIIVIVVELFVVD